MPADTWDLVFKPELASKLKGCGIMALDTPTELVPTALNKGRPVVLDEPGSDVSTAVRHLATKLTHQFGGDEGGAADANGSGKGKKRKLFSKA